MKMITKTIPTLLFAVLAAGACGSDKSGDDGKQGKIPEDAALSIVGDTNVFMENKWKTELSVKYHDSEGEPLAGLIEFEIVGSARGASLVKDSATTDEKGVATVIVEAGAEGEASFRVRATAESAEDVDWRVSVKGQVTARDATIPGRYELNSRFDLVAGNDELELFVEITSDDNGREPIVSWLLDMAEDKVNEVEDLIGDHRSIIDPILYELLTEFAPNIVGLLIEFSADLSEIVSDFGVISELNIVENKDAESRFSGTHTVTGVYFTVDNAKFQYTMEELFTVAEYEPDVVDVEVTYNDKERTLTLSNHTLSVPYGPLLVRGLQNIFIPRVSATYGSLGDLLAGEIDCVAVGDIVGHGTDLFASIPLLPDVSDVVANAVEGACEDVLEDSAEDLIEDIQKLSEGVSLTIGGTAKGVDTDGNNEIDVLQSGAWTGEIERDGLGSSAIDGSPEFRGNRK